MQRQLFTLYRRRLLRPQHGQRLLCLLTRSTDSMGPTHTSTIPEAVIFSESLTLPDCWDQTTGSSQSNADIDTIFFYTYHHHHHQGKACNQVIIATTQLITFTTLMQQELPAAASCASYPDYLSTTEGKMRACLSVSFATTDDMEDGFFFGLVEYFNSCLKHAAPSMASSSLGLCFFWLLLKARLMNFLECPSLTSAAL